MRAMEDHELAKPVIHPPGPSQLVLSGRINMSGGAASNPVQQLWTVGVNPVESTSTPPVSRAKLGTGGPEAESAGAPTA